MKKKAVCIKSDLSEAAELAQSVGSHAPRMTKNIEVRSSYYSSDKKKHPFASTLLELEIDCSLLKLAVIITVCFIMLWTFCSLKRKHRAC